jgi:hypothetical protein
MLGAQSVALARILVIQVGQSRRTLGARVNWSTVQARRIGAETWFKILFLLVGAMGIFGGAAGGSLFSCSVVV